MNYSQLTKSAPVVLVEFYASWCPHCQRMMPIVAQVKELVAGQADVYQFDIDQNNELATQEQVESIPTFILYKGGKEVWRQSGEMKADALLKQVESAIGEHVPA